MNLETESQEVGSLPVMGVEVGGVSNGANFKRKAHGERQVVHLKARELVKDLICRYQPFEK